MGAISGAVPRLKRMIGVCWSLYSFALALAVQPAGAQERHVPEIGSQVPSYVLKARIPSQECLTDIKRHDPCASVKIDKILFTIAWDSQTKAITYIFTDDRHLVTDSELGVGGSCRLVDESERPYELVHYMDWVITPQWADMVGVMSGDAVWYAALRKETSNAEYGKIVGFLQSRYLTVGK